MRKFMTGLLTIGMMFMMGCSSAENFSKPEVTLPEVKEELTDADKEQINAYLNDQFGEDINGTISILLNGVEIVTNDTSEVYETEESKKFVSTILYEIIKVTQPYLGDWTWADLELADDTSIEYDRTPFGDSLEIFGEYINDPIGYMEVLD